MVFNSVQYALFLPIVLGLYWLLRRRHQNALLLIASYIFYGAWDYRFLGLMWLSTLTDYAVGRLLGSTQDDRRRKRIFFVSLVVNLGILGFFKYFNFFVESAADLMKAFGFTPDLPTLRVLLPVGISFYTFHGISYTYDVYRRDIEPAHDLLDFAVFIAYFPQLVAGPIGRAHIQLPQFTNDRTKPDRAHIRSAVFLILLGLFRKVVIADGLAPMVNETYVHAASAGWVRLLMGAFGFALQLYGDFAGYSDIARGSSRLFGIELIRNFEQPFLARSVTDFWRTWHISLSTWLRDYLFVPLGGSKGNNRQASRAIMITMLIAGLWHGAQWTFVTFGGIIGVIMVFERLTAKAPRPKSEALAGPVGSVAVGEGTVVTTASGAAAQSKSSARKEWPPRVDFRRDLFAIMRTFTIICLAAVFFRAATFHQAAVYLKGIFTLRSGPVAADALWALVLLGTISFAIDIAQRNSHDETVFLKWNPGLRGFVYAALLLGIVVYSGSTPVPFLYFQF